MKKFFVIIALSVTTLAHAQEYKPFKVNVSVGVAIPTGSGSNAGVLFSVEPKYSVTSHLELGVRLENALTERGVTFTNTTVSGAATGISSGLLTANYSFGPFSHSNVRPFIGAGLGVFFAASGKVFSFEQNQTNGQLYVADYSGIGGMIRAGVKVGHFVVGVDYNAVPTHVYNLASINFETKSSYTGFRVGFDVGGGRR